MNAEILTIGTELLLGEITDTNTGFLARSLASIGVNVFRTTSVGDNQGRISSAIREILERVDLLITTGGLGPTIDDPTREAVAAALGRPLTFHEDLWEHIQGCFIQRGRQATANNRRQAYLPQGAEVIHNPVGTAPAFLVQTDTGTLISLPGVPLEMETLMLDSVLPLIRSRFHLSGVIRARLLHTVGVGESVLDARIGAYETFSNPTVGLAAHAGQVDIRLTARAENEAQAIGMLDPLETEIRALLGDRIYGIDGTSLEECAVQPWEQDGLQINVIESGLDGLLSSRLSRFRKTFRHGVVLPALTAEEFEEATLHAAEQAQQGVLLAAHLAHADGHTLQLQLVNGGETCSRTHAFAGPPGAAAERACTLALDFLRTRGAPDP